eukprot:3036969-Pleurochrysis_carterae.AAC.2
MHWVDCAGDHPCSPGGGKAAMELWPTRGGAAQHMACRVCPRATAEQIRMCAKVDDARDARDVTVPEEVWDQLWDQPYGRQLTPARAGIVDRRGDLVRDVAVLALASEARRR